MPRVSEQSEVSATDNECTSLRVLSDLRDAGVHIIGLVTSCVSGALKKSPQGSVNPEELRVLTELIKKSLSTRPSSTLHLFEKSTLLISSAGVRIVLFRIDS
jgi:hypothetical protein